MNSKLPFMLGMREAFEKKLFTITTRKTDAIVQVFMDWFNHSARLKPVPDLQNRIQAMEPKLRKMARNLDLSFHDGKLVIKTDAESESLLNLLKRGSDWFDPHQDVNAAILVALANGSQVS